MTDSNRPDEGPAADSTLSFDDGVDAIANLMTAPDEEPGQKVEASNEDAEDEADAAEAEGAEDEAEQTDDAEAAEGEDGPGEVGKGGKFVSNDAKVTLNDGTVITVQDLKRGFMSQQSFTRSTTEVATERKALAEHKSQLGNIANSLAQQRDFLLQAAQAFLPKAPDREMMQSDPFGYMQAKADYDEKMQIVNQLSFQRQQEGNRMTEEQKAEQQERLLQEANMLVERAPEFRDNKTYQQFWSDALETVQDYGYSPEEFTAAATDHRIYLIMRDLVKYRKAVKAAPKVKQDIVAKPKLMQGGKRMDPKAKTSREYEAKRDHLRKTGDFDAGVELLKSFNL